jgi:hypothetical protein
VRRSLRSWLWRVPLDQEVDEELSLHVELRTRELIAQGMDPKAAREMATRRMATSDASHARASTLAESEIEICE